MEPQICLWHCTHMSHCTTTVVYICTPHYYTYKSNKHNLQQLLHSLLSNICQKQMSLLNWAHMPYLPNMWWAYMSDVCKCTCHTWSHWHKPEVLHIYNNAKEDHHNDNDNKSQLQRLVWPIGQISQKNVACTMWYWTHTDGRQWLHLTRQISQ